MYDNKNRILTEYKKNIRGGMMAIKKTFLKMKLTDIIPYENNPRYNDEAVDDVIESIKQCENLDPIEIDENNIILSGHTRHKALQKLGYTETDAIKYSGLTEKQKKKYRLLANKTAEKAKWNFEKLENEIFDVDFDGYDFGFDVVSVNVDDFGEDFTLPDGEKNEINTMTFTVHEKQKEIIESAMNLIDEKNIKETYGNTNKNGNRLFEVVRQWVEQKKLK